MKEKMTVIHAEDDRVNMDVLFPIKNEDELQAFEDILKDFDLRTFLVILYNNIFINTINLINK